MRFRPKAITAFLNTTIRGRIHTTPELFDPIADRILLRGLMFHGYHGVLIEERKLGQKFIVDMDVFLDLKKAGLTDNLEHTVSYASIYANVKSVVEGDPVNLLEHLATKVSDKVFSEFPQVTALRTRIGKPHVAVSGPVDYLGVDIFRWQPKEMRT